MRGIYRWIQSLRRLLLKVDLPFVIIVKEGILMCSTMSDSLKIAAFLLHFVAIGAVLGIPTYESCVINENLNGLCRRFNDCSVEIFVKEQLIPQYCNAAMGPNQEVCCPIGINCGIKGPIDRPSTGGYGAAVNEWPWMVLFVRRQALVETEIEYYCNGVLINDQYVLTTGSCVFVTKSFFVRLGEYNSKNVNDGANYLDVAVANTSFHPKYNPNRRYHDLALIRLIDRIQLRPGISPICLPLETLSSTDGIGRQGIVTGWSWNYNSGSLYSQIIERDVKVMNSEVCNYAFQNDGIFSRSFPVGLNKLSHICLGTSVESEFGIECMPPASGSPFIHLDSGNGKWILEGINTASTCSATKPLGVYTSVRNFENLQWIKDVAFN